jgi:hypothetical protein
MGKSRKGTQVLKGLVGSAFAMGLMFGAADLQAANFSAKTLKGNYGCLGHASFSGTGIGELMQLSFDGNGGASGSMNLGLSGEQCNLTLSGSYSVNTNGTGKVDLTWSGGTEDPDSDVDCSTLNGVSQHMGLVIEGGGKAFDFESLDDFLTGATITGTDPGDITDPFVGSCKSQSK